MDFIHKIRVFVLYPLRRYFLEYYENEVYIMKNIREIVRGDIYCADLNPVVGSEQGGYRPVLIIQNDMGNMYSPTVIVAPMTSKPKRLEMQTHVLIEKIGELEKDSYVLLEQIRTIDKSRLHSYWGHISDESIAVVETALKKSLGLIPIKKSDDLEMCLCPACANAFYETNAYKLIRVDRFQIEKDTCTYCNVRQGYDYIIRKRKSNVSNKSNHGSCTFDGGRDHD